MDEIEQKDSRRKMEEEAFQESLNGLSFLEQMSVLKTALEEMRRKRLKASISGSKDDKDYLYSREKSLFDRLVNLMEENCSLVVGKCPSCSSIVRLYEQRCLQQVELADEWHKSMVISRYILAADGGEYDELHSGQNRLKAYWACNDCIDHGRALQADPAQQQWADVTPYYAYFDDHRKCESCGCEFVFTKEEQKHWYETLHFWVQARPKFCKSCKKKKKLSGKPPRDGSGE